MAKKKKKGGEKNTLDTQAEDQDIKKESHVDFILLNSSTVCQRAVEFYEYSRMLHSARLLTDSFDLVRILGTLFFFVINLS